MKRFVLGMMVLLAMVSIAATLPAQATSPAVHAGDVRIIAQWMVGQTFKASTTLVHVTQGPLATLSVVLPTTIVEGNSVCPIAIGKDQFGNPHTGDPVKWSSSDTNIVKIGIPTTLITTGGPLLSCPASDTTVAGPPLSQNLTRSPFNRQRGNDNMQWTAIVQSITPTSNGLETGVVLSDGASQKFVEQFQTDGSLLSLRNQVRQRTVVADAIHTKPMYAVGDVLDLTPDAVIPPPPPPDPIPPTDAEIPPPPPPDPIPPTDAEIARPPPPDPIPPTDAEIARANFFAQYATWQSMQRGALAGLVDAQTVATQLATVQKTFDPSYASNL